MAGTSRIWSHVAQLRQRMLALALALVCAAWSWTTSPAIAEKAARTRSDELTIVYGVRYGCRNKLTGIVRPVSSTTVRCRYNEIRVLRNTASAAKGAKGA